MFYIIITAQTRGKNFGVLAGSLQEKILPDPMTAEVKQFVLLSSPVKHLITIKRMIVWKP